MNRDLPSCTSTDLLARAAAGPVCLACFFLSLAAAPPVRFLANIASLLRISQPGRKFAWDIVETGTLALHRTTYQGRAEQQHRNGGEAGGFAQGPACADGRECVFTGLPWFQSADSIFERIGRLAKNGMRQKLRASVRFVYQQIVLGASSRNH